MPQVACMDMEEKEKELTIAHSMSLNQSGFIDGLVLKDL
jgi:hypothetical protein